MELTQEAQTAMKDALNGKLSDNIDDLIILMENLRVEKSTTQNHGKYKRIDNAIEKIRTKLTKLRT